MGRPSLLSSLSFPPLPSPGLLSLSALPQLVCQSRFWLSEVPPQEPLPLLSSPPSQPSLVVPSPSRPSASQALDAPRGQLTRRMALLLLSLPSLSPRLATGVSSATLPLVSCPSLRTTSLSPSSMARRLMSPLPSSTSTPLLRSARPRRTLMPVRSVTPAHSRESRLSSSSAKLPNNYLKMLYSEFVLTAITIQN